MGELGRLVEAYRDRTDPRVSDAWIGRKVGVGRSAIGPWLAGQSMPKAPHLRRLATVIGQPYDRVLEAALVDAGYLLKESVGNAQHPAPIDADAIIESDREMLEEDRAAPGRPRARAPRSKPRT